jgi:hypothetical protein
MALFLAVECNKGIPAMFTITSPFSYSCFYTFYALLLSLLRQDYFLAIKNPIELYKFLNKIFM